MIIDNKDSLASIIHVDANKPDQFYLPKSEKPLEYLSLKLNKKQ